MRSIHFDVQGFSRTYWDSLSRCFRIFLSQPRVLRFGCFQNGNISIGILP
jgi:hypothetical protein